MFTRARLSVLAGFLGLLFLTAGPAQAIATYSYVGNPPTNVTIDFTTSLTGAQLQNLAAGTDITASLTSFTIDAAGLPPPTDQLGFPVGVTDITSVIVLLGTDAAGLITSWDISAILFASYPAVPGEDPFDFYCEYSISSKSGAGGTVDQSSLASDHNAGLCVPNNSSVQANAGFWTTDVEVDVPEPATLALFGAGLAGLGWIGRRRKAA